MEFDDFWRTFKDALGVSLTCNGDNADHAELYKDTIHAAWNDGRQLLLTQIVLLLSKTKKKADTELEKHKKGTHERIIMVVQCNLLRALIVQISEMKV